MSFHDFAPPINIFIYTIIVLYTLVFIFLFHKCNLLSHVFIKFIISNYLLKFHNYLLKFHIHKLQKYYKNLTFQKFIFLH